MDDRDTATGDQHTKCREDRYSCSRHMLADRPTDTQTDKLIANTPLPYRGGVIITSFHRYCRSQNDNFTDYLSRRLEIRNLFKWYEASRGFSTTVVHVIGLLTFSFACFAVCFFVLVFIVILSRCSFEFPVYCSKADRPNRCTGCASEMDDHRHVPHIGPSRVYWRQRVLSIYNSVSSDGYISNVQCHKGITYHFQFLTFGHSGAQGWAP